jgi:PEP-CTERM motif
MSKSASRFLLVAFASTLAVPAFAQPAPYSNPGFEAPSGGNFIAGNTGVLKGWFTGSDAGNTILAGVRVNGVDYAALGLQNTLSAYGDSFVFGPVTAGATVVPFIQVLGGDRFYQLTSLNADGINHAFVSSYAGDAFVPSGFNFAFEDIPGGGDFDYNDFGFILKSVAVPEPASWALLITGFGVAGASVRIRRGKLKAVAA